MIPSLMTRQTAQLFITAGSASYQVVLNKLRKPLRSAVGFSLMGLLAGSLLVGCARRGPYQDHYAPGTQAQTLTVAAAGKLSAHHYLGVHPVAATLGAGLFAYERLSPNVVMKRLQHAGVNVFVVGDTLQINLMADKVFDPDGGHIRLERTAVMADVAALLNRYSQQPIEVMGHSDDRGDLRDQYLRSRAQAETIMAFLSAYGVPPKRMHAVGVGGELSAGENVTASGHADNRYITLTTCKNAPAFPFLGQMRHWF